jgi:hypothetical protein
LDKAQRRSIEYTGEKKGNFGGHNEEGVTDD